MLGEILQTVGEGTAFYFGSYAGYHTAACLGFPFVSDSGRSGDMMRCQRERGLDLKPLNDVL